MKKSFHHLLNSRVFACMACVLVLYGCPERPSEKGEVLAEVYGEKLYLDEAKASIPASMFDKDSAAVITKFVNDWILNQVLYRHASKIIDQKALDKEIENYRLSLTIARFEALWLEENLNTSITQDEVQRYYLGNTGQLIPNMVLVSLPLLLNQGN